MIRPMTTPLALAVVMALGALVALGAWLFRRIVPKENPDDWPTAEGTIQFIRKVTVNAGRYSYQVDVGDFSFTVNGEYYSGRLKISRSFSTHQALPKDLANQKIQVRYNPLNPDKYSVPPQEIGGFLLDPFDETNVSDADPFDLEIDKI
jgi:hypothetical protein